MPRSGSTLLEAGVRTEYEHVTLVKGVTGFAEAYLPGELDEYLAALRELALRLYEGAADGKPYFLDKTPRYSHIAAELMALFPDGKFVFLWRNPLAIAASIIETFGEGKWNIKRPFSADLYAGLPNLVDTYSRERERAHALCYEDLVLQPDVSVRAVLDYLELPQDKTLTTRFTDLPMRNLDFWDPTGTLAYDSISREPLDKWKATMATSVRRRWCARYVERLGELGGSARYAFSDLLEHAKAPDRRRLGIL